MLQMEIPGRTRDEVGQENKHVRRKEENTMKKNIIFVYSGTGNCLNMAKNIAKELGNTDIISVRKAPAVTDVEDADTVGFVFPCYGGGAPEDFLTNIKNLQIDPKVYTYGVTVSAVYPGIGLSQLNSLIPLKYWRTATHHCSCVWLFPHQVTLPLVSVEKSQARCEKIAVDIAKNVQKREISRKKKPGHNPFNTIENKVWPAIAKTKVKKFAVSDACIGCGQCVRVCPRENIKLENGRAVIGKDCTQCLGCLQFCPNKAISIGKITDKREHFHNPKVYAADLVQEVIHID